MFDDQHQNQPIGGVVPPKNLPLGEPEDMFAGTEDSPMNAPEATPAETQPVRPLQPAQMQPVAPPSAVSVGMLKPKEMAGAAPPAAPPVGQDMPPTQVPPADMHTSMSTVSEPSAAKKIMMIVIALVVLLVLVGIGWFVYASFFSSRDDKSSPVIDNSSPLDVSDKPLFNQKEVDNVLNTETEIDSSILFGDEKSEESLNFGATTADTIDTDADNLDNVREADIGTDPNNWDTDGDGLSDGDEVVIWKTDPLSPDSDGDTYLDGDEVKNGYNPAGPGRIFEPPTDDDIQ